MSMSTPTAPVSADAASVPPTLLTLGEAADRCEVAIAELERLVAAGALSPTVPLDLYELDEVLTAVYRDRLASSPSPTSSPQG